MSQPEASDEDREKIASLLREIGPIGIDLDNDLPLLSHWIVVSEWTTGDVDYVVDMADGVTSTAHRVGLLICARESLMHRE
jgi:hypothetical protein